MESKQPLVEPGAYDDIDHDPNLDDDEVDNEPISWAAVRMTAILGAAILFVAAFVSISWLSSIYLIAGCLYLSSVLKPAATVFFIVYASLVLVVKVIFAILAFATSYLNKIGDLPADILRSLGLRFLSNTTMESVMTMFPEIIALLGLCMIKFLARRKEEKDEKPAANANHGNAALCRFWYCLAMLFMTIAYLFGTSVGYALLTSNFYILTG